jgi:aspartate/methionine/tyrosine aminotransferase
MRPTDFAYRLERARASGLPLLDLTESDPARCGLGWEEGELASILAAPQAGGAAAPVGVGVARDAVASYLAGKDASVDPALVFFAPSRAEARRMALDAACERDGEALVPSPARPYFDPAGPAARPTRSYALEFDGAWHLDRRSVKKAVSPSTRAIVVGNPADPTGALLSRDELSLLEELCRDRELALVADESELDTALEPGASALRAARCLTVHVSGAAGVCGLPGLGCEWIAVAGPDRLVRPALERLDAARAELPASSALLALPSLLARRERFLEALRARLARNRGAIAAAALREAPWTLQWGGGGWWAVLQINPVQDTDELCNALLDSGVVVSPGHLDGFPREGHLVVSLLPGPAVFDEALHRLETQLRGTA